MWFHCEKKMFCARTYSVQATMDPLNLAKNSFKMQLKLSFVFTSRIFMILLSDSIIKWSSIRHLSIDSIVRIMLVGECIKIVKMLGTEKFNLITYTIDCQHGTACYATMKRPPAPSFHMPFPHCTIFANCFHNQPLHHSISFSNNACLVIIMTYSNLFLICSGIFYVS